MKRNKLLTKKGINEGLVVASIVLIAQFIGELVKLVYVTIGAPEFIALEFSYITMIITIIGIYYYLNKK
jgi:hypothetical protein